jgi:hypothetical protein
VIVPEPVPEGVTVHQDWLLEAVHAAAVVTVKAVVPGAAVTGWSEGVTVRVVLVPVIETSSMQTP